MGKLAQAATARILTIDIERLCGLAPVWDQKPRFNPVRNWVRRPQLLCFAAKHYGRKKMEFESLWRDRERMVLRSWQLYDEADIVITYNGIGFDDKHLREEWAKEGLPPPRPWKPVDLYRVNGGLFAFPSKSMQELCDQFKLPGKTGHYDYEQAEACYAGDREAQRVMREYNEGDVLTTERLYEQLLPWIHNHPHVTATTGELRCMRCGPVGELVRCSSDWTAQVWEYPMYRCSNCRGIVVDRKQSKRIGLTKGVKS